MRHLYILGFMLGGIIFLVGCEPDPGSSQVAPSKSPSALSVGQVYSDPKNGWDIVVTDVQTSSAAIGQLGFPLMSKGVFLQVFVELTNTGSDAHALGADRFNLHDSKGRTWKAKAFTENPNWLVDLSWGTDVDPGTSLAGLLSFDIPLDCSALWLGVVGGGRIELGDVSGGEVSSRAAGRRAVASNSSKPTPTPAVEYSQESPGGHSAVATQTRTPAVTLGQKSPIATSSPVDSPTASSETTATGKPAPATTVPTKVLPTSTRGIPTRTPIPLPLRQPQARPGLFLTPNVMKVAPDGSSVDLTIHNFSTDRTFAGWLEVDLGKVRTGANVASLAPGGSTVLHLSGWGSKDPGSSDFKEVRLDPAGKLGPSNIMKSARFLDGSDVRIEVLAVTQILTQPYSGGEPSTTLRVQLRNQGKDWGNIEAAVCWPDMRNGAPELGAAIFGQTVLDAGEEVTLEATVSRASPFWRSRDAFWVCGWGTASGSLPLGPVAWLDVPLEQ